MSSMIVNFARGSSPAGQNASPTAQTSAGHSSNPSLVSTSTAYMNLPPTNSARVITGAGARSIAATDAGLDRRVVILAGEMVRESVSGMEQANAEPLAAAVRLEDHRAGVEMAAGSGQQLVFASDEDRPWGTDAGGFERGVLARLADFEVERTRAVDDAAAMSRQPRKHGGGQFGRVAMLSGVRRGAHAIVEHALAVAVATGRKHPGPETSRAKPAPPRRARAPAVRATPRFRGSHG